MLIRISTFSDSFTRSIYIESRTDFNTPPTQWNCVWIDFQSSHDLLKAKRSITIQQKLRVSRKFFVVVRLASCHVFYETGMFLKRAEMTVTLNQIHEFHSWWRSIPSRSWLKKKYSMTHSQSRNNDECQSRYCVFSNNSNSCQRENLIIISLFFRERCDY